MAKEIKKHGGKRSGAGRPTILDVKMSPSELKARERQRKREAGLLDRTFWLREQDIETVEKLQEKALKTLD